jgi:hypothetical protein
MFIIFPDFKKDKTDTLEIIYTAIELF